MMRKRSVLMLSVMVRSKILPSLYLENRAIMPDKLDRMFNYSLSPSLSLGWLSCSAAMKLRESSKNESMV